MASHLHEYAAHCRWSGTTAVGYDDYDRSHEVVLGDGSTTLRMSADPAFGGTGELSNPEQLLLAAATSCQMLSFLAVAARARLDVLQYDDDCQAFMPDDDQPVRVTRIVLRPRITIAALGRPVDTARLERLVAVAHEECFIARSLRSEIEIVPEFVIR